MAVVRTVWVSVVAPSAVGDLSMFCSTLIVQIIRTIAWTSRSNFVCMSTNDGISRVFCAENLHLIINLRGSIQQWICYTHT